MANPPPPASAHLLLHAEVAIPLQDTEANGDSNPDYSNLWDELATKVTDLLWIPHEGEVNRSR